MWPAALTRYVTGNSKPRSLVGSGAERATRAAAAATAARLAREIGDRRCLAAAGKGEARDQHPRPCRLACRTHLGRVTLGETCEDLELLGAALAPILVDGHLSERF